MKPSLWKAGLFVLDRVMYADDNATRGAWTSAAVELTWAPEVKLQF